MLKENETIRTFLADAVRQAVNFRRMEADFDARGEAAWQQYQRDAVSRPAQEVFDRLRHRIDARRRTCKATTRDEPAEST